MDWYCAVWNSDKVNNNMGAQILYDKLCRNDNELVSENSSLENFYKDISEKSYLVKADRGEGYVILSCEFNEIEAVNDLVQEMARKYKLSFYDPQSVYFINFNN